MLRITIDEKPLPKARHKQRRMGSKLISYDPQSEDKRRIGLKVLKQLKEMNEKAPYFAPDEPLRATMCFYLPIPKSFNTGLKNKCSLNLHPHTKKRPIVTGKQGAK